ncbi:MAG: hypothetical protein AAFV25_10780 [Bacteroidota bacterium]
MSETYTHPSCASTKHNFTKEKLNKVIRKLLKNNGINPNKAKLNKDGQLEFNEIPNLKLHTLMLEVEELGLDLKLTKKTMIEIR